MDAILRNLLWKPQYPLDDRAASDLDDLRNFPYPPYPAWTSDPRSTWYSSALNTLHPLLPLSFALVYYLAAKWANVAIVRRKGGARDLTKDSKVLRGAIIMHNAALTVYSAWTFVNVAPAAITFLYAGWLGAGWEGFKLAACSIPTNYPHLARFVYFFYLSKYYEVVDSLILILKGKEIGQLQSYHHAGALICMWIAYRYQSQNVWVFTAWNSGVHTLMYMYYVFAAMRWPFPRALKRSLTTLQMLQIASGTIVTNISLFLTLYPGLVFKTASGSKLLKQLDPLWSDAYPSPLFISRNRALQCPAEAATALGAAGAGCSCIESRGAALALHVNTAYMLPLLVLFLNFFVQSYLRGGTKARTRGSSSVSKRKAAINGHSNGHANGLMNGNGDIKSD
ncbi:unnamed protein product [Tilletia laevis]|uniref:Elongation of fatty acids protein n=3 Tax=Tilletia TaxID=13289 RepID=A0A8X7MWB2_9BASI|nr:hypothetical protein CF336_g5290 [Tilletia laevis]KAE8251716.1 hypothetical protein A4X06_0g2569 [Tilletia controversa]KAE8263345.1 hypothetical protein A4X03_0g1757 [Tilletia caries]KAE8197319.1 hypothetical protein CF335_g4641 [Tilletia laevis]CAD6885747.1 unnamed protein product [Tilletia caries]